MNIIVVGAGPSGLLLSLLLTRNNPNITVTLYDAASTLDSRPRAAHYAPSAIRELARAGVLEDVRKQGIMPLDVAWRKLDGSEIARFNDMGQEKNPERLTVLPLNMLGEVLLSHVNKQKNAKVIWDANVKDVGTEGEKAWVKVQFKDGREEKIYADYVAGCDGANSQVRRSLFGDSYPGKTWDAQIIATNVYYPFEKFGYDDMNFIIHPEHYYMAARITQDGLWRVSYGEDTKLDFEEVQKNQPKKFEIMLPGHPKPSEYKLLNANPYRIHQRCSPSFRVGRVLLAADAAHLCNPFGGLGLTGGIVDVGGLYECLDGIQKGLADDSILDKYDEIRRKMWHDIIDPVSSDNFRRVSATDPETAREKDPWLVTVEKANKDPEFKKEIDKGMYSICHDFTQYYNKKQGTAKPITPSKL